MKRFISLFVVLALLLCMGSAYAFTWKDATASECTDYIVRVTKYAKMDAAVGTAYQEAPNLSAKIGDTVLFGITAADALGQPVNTAEIEVHHLADVKQVGALYTAKVVGPEPWVKVSITEKTAIGELTYNGKPVTVSGATVTIGDLVFTRDAKGVVTDVQSNLNTADMLGALAKLGIDIQAVYSGDVLMTGDVLISNFGKICETTDTAAWYVAAEEPVLGIPKTGDASTVVFPMMAMVFGVAICLPKRKH